MVIEKIRVLLVEDDPDIAQLMVRRLERLNYEMVAVVDNGADAIREAATNQPDIVLMDVNICGEMDGIETATILQRDYGQAVIYVTSNDDDETIEKAEKSGAQGYVLKPALEREVHATIKLALSRHRRDKEVSSALRLAGRVTEQLRQSMGEAALKIGGRYERSLGEEIRSALGQGQFELHYQPRVALRSGEIVGVEALLRWNHPRRGLLLPGQFLPVAEELGFIEVLDEWVLRNALSAAKDWRVEQPELRVTVNVSPVSFRRDALLTRVGRILSDVGFDPAGLELDITESILVQNSPQDMDLLREVKATGVTLALDNFGLGYAAISNLQNSPFDTIKIDRSFVRKAAGGRNASAVVQGIIYLADAMGLSTVAEGVETREELRLLAEHGCHDIQGHLFSAPMLLPQMRALISQGKRLDFSPEGMGVALPVPSGARRASHVMLDPIIEQQQEIVERLVEQRTKALQESNAELEAFADLVSHDLRAPLRALIGFSTILGDTARGKLDDEETRILSLVQRAGKRMSEMVDALLALSRLARAEVLSVNTDLSALVAEVVGDMRQEYPSLRVETEIEPGLRVRGDPRMIRGMLENLVGNALKFSSLKSVANLHFTETVTPRGKAFCLADRGAGFDMEFAGKLFGVFQRLHSEREFPGTGIGLASVKRIVERHGGQVWAESGPEGGAKFYFTLPAADEQYLPGGTAVA